MKHSLREILQIDLDTEVFPENASDLPSESGLRALGFDLRSEKPGDGGIGLNIYYDTKRVFHNS